MKSEYDGVIVRYYQLCVLCYKLLLTATSFTILIFAAVSKMKAFVHNCALLLVAIAAIHAKDLIPGYSPPPCEDLELEAAVAQTVRMIPQFILDTVLSTVNQEEITEDHIHQVTCTLADVNSLDDLKRFIPAENHWIVATGYRQAVQYFQMIGGHAGMVHFLYELHELLEHLDTIGYPDQSVGSVCPVKSWKFFTNLQAERSQIWELLVLAGRADVTALVNFMVYTPEKIARLLNSETGTELCVSMGGETVEDCSMPSAEEFREVSNYMVAKLEILDLLIQRGWLELQ